MQHVRELVESELLPSTLITAWLGFGESLFMEFMRIQRPDTSEPNVPSDKCKLQTNFATWSIEGPINGTSVSDSRDCLESATQSLIGAIIYDLELSVDAILTVRFDGARLLKIMPWPVADGHSDAWSLSLPDDRVLAVSNAGQFAIVEKNVPIREWFGKKL